MTQNQFIGTWKLISAEVRSEDGQIAYPYGQNATGYIMYNPDGYMSVAIMKANRANFSSQDITGGTTEEKASAAETYVSYAGKYEIRENTVIHHLDVSLFPNWINTDQERFFKFEGNRLTLSTGPFLILGKHQTAHLIWERV
jgi:hypothetical protein